MMAKKSLFGKCILRDGSIYDVEDKAGNFKSGDVVIGRNEDSYWQNKHIVVLGKIMHETDGASLVGYCVKDKKIRRCLLQTTPKNGEYPLLHKVLISEKERLIKNIKRTMTRRINKKILEAV